MPFDAKRPSPLVGIEFQMVGWGNNAQALENYLSAHGDGLDEDYSMFSDQMYLDHFFEHHPKLISPVLVELISPLLSWLLT